MKQSGYGAVLPNWHKKSFHSGVLVCPYLQLSKSDPNHYSPCVHQGTTTSVATLVVGTHGLGSRCLRAIACGQLPVRTAVDVSDADML